MHYYRNEFNINMIKDLPLNITVNIYEGNLPIDVYHNEPSFTILERFMSVRAFHEVNSPFIKKGDVLFTLINKREAKITESGSLTGRFYKLDFT